MQASYEGKRPAELLRSTPCLRGVAEAVLAGEGRVLADSPRNPRSAVALWNGIALCVGESGPSAVRLLRSAIGLRETPWVAAPGAWREKLRRVVP